MSPSDFLVTALELDGNDLGPLINYTKEKLYDEAEKHFTYIESIKQKNYASCDFGLGPTNESMMGTRGIRHPRSLHLLRLDFGSRVW